MSIDADKQEKYRQIMERVVIPESVRRANSPEEIERRLRKPLAPGQVWTVADDVNSAMWLSSPYMKTRAS